MTMTNIVSGFKTTGVYPVDRNAVIEEEVDHFFHMKKDASLKYIPLFSPLNKVSGARSSLVGRQYTKKDFTQQEHSLFQKVYEDGWNISDAKYEAWVKMYHPFDRPGQATREFYFHF